MEQQDKGHYMKHLQRKTPCDNINDKIENIVEKKVDELVKETKLLGDAAVMQIAPEQGQFLEIIVKILKIKQCLEIFQ